MDALNALTPADQRLFHQFGAAVPADPPFQCVHHAFRFHARAHPDAVAVQDGSAAISFAQLDRQSDCLAARLAAHGVTRGARVCLLVERSIPMAIGILGILKTGSAYIPVDAKVVSDAALAHILRDADARVVLTLSKFAPRVATESDSGALQVVLLDGPPCGCQAQGESQGVRCAPPEDDSRAEDGVYVIYTSGTTGVPKGVDVLHRNVVNLVCLAPGNLGMGPGVRVAQLMNIAFDMAAWEILGSLSNGATLVLRGQSSKEWRAAMRGVDVVIGTPSMLVPHEPAEYPNIKVVAVAGEACPKALADAWAKHTQFYNCCGPTEVTIVNTMHLHVAGQGLSIGRPTPNNSVYILDEAMQPTAIGVAGIMWAGGKCVSRGYLNLPEKTSERYKADPFVDDGSRMFNTGDLGVWRADGTLEHLGRIDDQVKVKGFRVELDGVAAAMESADGVKTAVALLIEGELWGFVTPGDVRVEEVQAATAKIQPYYAVPAHIVALGAFPRTRNDKTDKKALREMAMDTKKIKVEELVQEKPMEPLVTSRIANRRTDTSSSSSSSLTFHTSTEGVSKEEKDTTFIVPPLPVLLRQPNAAVDVRQVVLSGDSASSIEELKREVWDGYEKDVIPDKKDGKIFRNLRYQIFSLYRRLFSVVFVTNMGILLSVVIRGGANAQRLGLITLANLFVAILMRQDYVINTFFNVLCAVPTSWPLAIRRVCARVYHIGGLHSGAATSGVCWLVVLCGQATREVVQGGSIHASVATVAISYSILLLLVGIVVFAHPAMRSKRHDNFERVHRYFGWTSIILVWGQVVMLTNDYRGPQTLVHALVHSAPFWMLLVMTGSIILPWLRLRKVPVRSEVLSKHAVRLYFDYSTPRPGAFVRLSVHPLQDWHGFATISVPNQKGFSLVVSKAGDWTNTRIVEPPSAIWVRGAPCFGVLRIVPLFKRVVLVATGSGIGPCAPCILEQRVPIRLLWTSPNVRETFGNKLVDEILGASPDAVIYDTRRHGKPDMLRLTLRLVAEFDAEAVCIISNQKLTSKLVYGLSARGVPAFGAIWDS